VVVAVAAQLAQQEEMAVLVALALSSSSTT
jgi:hypothetical protein